MDSEDLAQQFERARPHLTSVAFRITGSLADAEDVVQTAWLKAHRSDTRDVANLAGWLTTITARAAFDTLKARRRRRETPWGAVVGREPAVESAEETALLADSVDRALLVVMARLSPAERAAFVLHDVFAMPFDQIAVILDRTAATTKKLASRARAKVHLGSDERGPDVGEHTRIVAAFLAASRDGDITALLRLLAPDVVRTVDPSFAPPGTAMTVSGASEVAEETRLFTARARVATVLLVDGRPGIAIAPAGRLAAIIAVTVGADSRIHGLRIVADGHVLAAARLTLPPT